MGDEFVEIHMADIRFFDREILISRRVLNSNQGSSTSSVPLATLAGVLGALVLSGTSYQSGYTYV